MPDSAVLERPAPPAAREGQESHSTTGRQRQPLHERVSHGGPKPTLSELAARSAQNDADNQKGIDASNDLLKKLNAGKITKAEYREQQAALARGDARPEKPGGGTPVDQHDTSTNEPQSLQRPRRQSGRVQPAPTSTPPAAPGEQGGQNPPTSVDNGTPPSPPPTNEGGGNQPPNPNTPPTPGTGDTVDEVHRDEQGRYIAGAANATEDLEKRILKEARDQVRREQQEGSAWNPRNWWRKVKFNRLEEYYVRRGVRDLREAAVANGNKFVQMDIIRNGAVNATARIGEHRSESRAKLEQMRLGQQIEGLNDLHGVEEATGRVKELLIDEVFKPIINGDANAGSPEAVQQLLAQFVENHVNDADTNVSDQVSRLFGENATQFGERARMFATNFYEVGQQMKQDIGAHRYSIDQIGEKVRVDLANSRWGAVEQSDLVGIDKWVGKLKAKNGFLANTLSEPALGALVSVATFGFARGIGTSARAASIGATAAGGVAGFVLGAVERWRRLGRDMKSHRAQTELGTNIDTTPREGTLGRIRDQFDTNKTLERFRYEYVANVKDLLTRDNADRPTVGGDGRSLQTLRNLDLSVGENRDALARRLGEIKERLRYSSAERVGIIQYESEGKVEHGRLELIKGLAEGRQQLIALLQSEGQSPADARAEVNRMINSVMGEWQARFTADKKQQDRNFMIYRVGSSAAHGVFGGLVGMSSALVTQEAMAGLMRGAEAILPINKSVNPTLIETMTGWKSDKAEGIYHLNEALSNNQPEAIVTSLNELGVQSHLDNNQFIIDSVTNPNGTQVDIPSHPTMQFNPDTKQFTFFGHVPDEVRNVLHDNQFDIGDTLPPAEFGGATGIDHVVVPGMQIEAGIPGGTELHTGQGGLLELWTKGVDGQPGVLLANGIQFDATGHMVEYNLVRPDLIQLGDVVQGKDITSSIKTPEIMEKFDSGKGIDQWYGNNTHVSDHNELRAYNYPTPDKPNAVTFDMSNMHQVSWQDGNIPYSFNVQDELRKGNATMALWEPGHPEHIRALVQMPADGKISYDWNSQETFKIWKEDQGGWVNASAADLSKMFMAETIPPDFKGASEVHPEFRRLFNLNFSMGVMSEKNGQNIFSSFATGFGEGGPIPSEIPSTVHTVIQEFKPVPHTLLTPPDDWEPMPIALPLTPRRHRNDVEEPDTEGSSFGGSFNYYEGGWDMFRRPDGSPATLTDVLQFANNNHRRHSNMFPPRIEGLSSNATLNTELHENLDGERSLELIRDTFAQTENIYVALSGAIGDVVVNSAYIEGLRKYADATGTQKNITLIVPPGVVSLVEPLALKYNCHIEPATRHTGIDKAKELINQGNIVNPLVLELDHTTGRPTVDLLQNNGVVVQDLFAASLGLYTHERSGNDRFSIFMADLLSVPPNQRLSIRAQTELPAGSDQIYDRLKRKFKIDDTKPQIGLVVEASHKMKRYSLDQWRDVIQQIKQQQPDAEVNVFFNPNPSSASYSESALRQALGSVPNLRLVSGNLSEQIVLLGKQKLLLSNDTGFAHVAATIDGGPQVLSLHVPAFQPNVWISDSNRHEGILPDPALLQDNFEPDEDDESKKWINRIPPSEIAQRALAQLQITTQIRPPTINTTVHPLRVTPASPTIVESGQALQNSLGNVGLSVNQLQHVARNFLGRNLTEAEQVMIVNDPQWGERLGQIALEEQQRQSQIPTSAPQPVAPVVTDETERTPEPARRVEETRGENREIAAVRAAGGVVEDIGLRPTMEDAQVMFPEFGPDRSFFGVYDGHGGRNVADLAARTLHGRLDAHLSAGLTPTQALRQAFLDVDQNAANDHLEGGAVALTAYIDGNQLYTANAGDARAVLNRNGRAERLSQDHKPTDEVEQRRIQDAGGFILNGRVVGDESTLAVARALGDTSFGDRITAEPFINQTTLEQEDRQLILACDGLWDVVEDQEAIDAIRGITDPEEAAQRLRALAQERGSGDNITIQVINLEPKSVIAEQEDPASSDDSNPEVPLSRENFLNTINDQLTEADTAGRSNETANVNPQSLTNFLASSESLFMEGSTIHELAINVVGNELQLSGNFDFPIGRGNATIQLKRASFMIGPDGKLLLQDGADYALVNQVPGVPEDVINRMTNGQLLNLDRRLKRVLGTETPGWNVRGFSIDDGNIGVQFEHE